MEEGRDPERLCVCVGGGDEGTGEENKKKRMIRNSEKGESQQGGNVQKRQGGTGDGFKQPRNVFPADIM